jgi:hypothetical protein
MRLSPLAGFGIAALVLANVGCQALTDLLPTLPTGAKPKTPTATPSPLPSVPPVSIPVILPTPVPTPTPAPTPVPTPTPAPTPPPDGRGSCSLPPSNPANPTCTVDPAALSGQVESALTRATQARPEYFDFNDKICENCYRVRDIDGYVAEVQRQLAGAGICSLWDGEELAVKGSNAASEQYDILTAAGYIRRLPGSYRGVCRPAWF